MTPHTPDAAHVTYATGSLEVLPRLARRQEVTRLSHSDRRSRPSQSAADDAPDAAAGPADGAAPGSGDAPTLVVHQRARELLAWLVPHTAAWPREQRHGITQHVVNLALRLHDALIAARHGNTGQRGESLREADIRLDQLRQYLQLAWQWQWMSDGQYQHACRLTAEIGRLIGGWRRRLRGPRE